MTKKNLYTSETSLWNTNNEKTSEIQISGALIIFFVWNYFVISNELRTSFFLHSDYFDLNISLLNKFVGILTKTKR